MGKSDPGAGLDIKAYPPKNRVVDGNIHHVHHYGKNDTASSEATNNATDQVTKR